MLFVIAAKVFVCRGLHLGGSASRWDNFNRGNYSLVEYNFRAVLNLEISLIFARKALLFVVGLGSCRASMMFILRTKDDFMRWFFESRCGKFGFVPILSKWVPGYLTNLKRVHLDIAGSYKNTFAWMKKKSRGIFGALVTGFLSTFEPHSLLTPSPWSRCLLTVILTFYMIELFDDTFTWTDELRLTLHTLCIFILDFCIDVAISILLIYFTSSLQTFFYENKIELIEPFDKFYFIPRRLTVDNPRSLAILSLIYLPNLLSQRLALNFKIPEIEAVPTIRKFLVRVLKDYRLSSATTPPEAGLILRPDKDYTAFREFVRLRLPLVLPLNSNLSGYSIAYPLPLAVTDKQQMIFIFMLVFRAFLFGLKITALSFLLRLKFLYALKYRLLGLHIAMNFGRFILKLDQYKSISRSSMYIYKFTNTNYLERIKLFRLLYFIRFRRILRRKDRRRFTYRRSNISRYYSWSQARIRLERCGMFPKIRERFGKML